MLLISTFNVGALPKSFSPPLLQPLGPSQHALSPGLFLQHQTGFTASAHCSSTFFPKEAAKAIL